jgi:hypothetical protein
VKAEVVANVAAQVVDRFLSSKRPVVSPPAACPCAQGPSCQTAAPKPAVNACPCQSAAPKPAADPVPVQPAPSPLPPAPEIVIADFVCEDDVRAALESSKKIYIGPKTIVTPSARDLGARHDILVLAKR